MQEMIVITGDDKENCEVIAMENRFKGFSKEKQFSSNIFSLKKVTFTDTNSTYTDFYSSIMSAELSIVKLKNI